MNVYKTLILGSAFVSFEMVIRYYSNLVTYDFKGYKFNMIVKEHGEATSEAYFSWHCKKSSRVSRSQRSRSWPSLVWCIPLEVHHMSHSVFLAGVHDKYLLMEHRDCFRHT